MATLERVTQLQQEGQSDPQIIQTLQQEGIAPNEINEALSQSKIKSAISSEQAAGAMPESPQLPGAMPTVPEQPGALPPQPGMQASMAQPGMQASMTPPSAMPPQPGTMPAVPEQPGALPPQPGMQASMTPPSAMPPQQSIMPPTQDYTAYPEEAGGYEQPGAYGAEGAYGDEYYGEGGADIETINEISEQIVEEKTAKIKKQVSSFSRFQEEIQLETQRLNERVKKIEDTINELQMTIIGKIGEYGKDIQNISKEMQVTQNSFSKILNPLTDTIRKVESLKEKSEKKETKKTSKKKSKK